MTSPSDAASSAFRTRLATLYLLRHSLVGLAVWGLLYGVVVLALRGALGLDRETLLWGLASLPLVFLVATVLAFRALPSVAATRALLDRHGHCGGLLMAADEVDTHGWIARPGDGPALRWRAGRAGGLCAVGLAFLVLAFLVPQSFARIGAPRLEIGRDVARLEDQLAVLKEEKVLDKQRAEALKEKLDQLRKDAAARDPLKTLEALDSVQDTTQKAAQDAAEAATRQMEDLARAGTLTDALEKAGDKLDQAQLGEAMSQLAGLMRKADAENKMLEDGAIDQEILDALQKGGPLTKEQMKKLSEALKGAKNGLARKVGRLVKAKLIDPDALKKCDKACECDTAGLAAYLKENGCDGLCDNLLDGDGDPGKGGINRGRGDAKLKFGDESSEQGIKFKDEELPPSELQSLKDSELEGLGTGTPKHKKGETPASGGALVGAKMGGGSSTGQVVLPRHRGAVERYFDRAAPKKK
jgi:hypothetical protein